MRFSVAAVLLALPCLASAATLTKVGILPSTGGHEIVVADGTKLHDGTWVVGDSANVFWGSSDQGKTWSQVPALPGDTIQTMGDALTSVQSYGIWTPSKGWHEMTFPASWKQIFGTEGSFTYVGSDGVAAIRASDTSALHYYTTADGFDTWTDFLIVANSDLPAGIDPIGWSALGKIWYILPDSGYARGTADGKVWSRIVLPSGITTEALTSQWADSILTLIGFDNDSQAMAGYSLDKGVSWVVGSPDQPGKFITFAQGGYFASLSEAIAINETVQAPTWISRSLGDWESLGMCSFMFLENGLPHVVKADGIYRVDLIGTGIARSGASASDLVRLERGASSTVAHLDASLRGKPWQVVGADGAVRAGGSVSSTRLELPAVHGAGWLKVGNTTVAIPAL